jgi:hypothetical protein
MFPRRFIRYGSIVILVTMGTVGMIGCAQKIQPKAWLSVEKAPMRVIIVDNEKDINPETVHMIVDHLMSVDYKDYKFNDKTNIGVTTSVDDQRHSSSSNKVELRSK